MKKSRFALFTIICLAASIAIGPVAVAQNCTELALALSQETYRAYAGTNARLLELGDLCTAEYSSASDQQKAQIQAAYEMFSGRTSSSSANIVATQHKMCESHYGSYWHEQVTSVQIQKAATDRAQILDECLNSTAFHMVTIVFQDNAVSASFRYGGGGETILDHVRLTPQSIGTCTVDLDQAAKASKGASEQFVAGSTLPSGDTLAVNCTRTGRKGVGASKPAYTFYPGGTLSVETASNDVVIPLYPYFAETPLAPPPIVAKLQQDISQNHVRAVGLAKRVSKIEKDVARLGSGVTFVLSPPKKPKLLNDGTGDCPAGSYTVGIRYNSVSGYAHGIASQLHTICRRLK